MSKLLSAALLFCLGLASPVYATTDALIEKARTARLAESPYWHILLRYEAKSQGYLSTVRHQPRFFVSPEGARSPEAELEATLHGWLDAANREPNQALSCRFPARIAWLREQLAVPAEVEPAASCPDLEQWLKAINPAQATLIFAADYLNNPSSMFGHTMLRLDTPEQTEETRLLAYTVNYAAQTQETNGLFFAFNGLTGGYPGMYSLLPYYEKVKEYNDLESRDLWEYQLNLSPAEIRRLLQHLWELKGISFPYFFFSDNCSYELLGLFEAARPGLALRRDFPVYAIPTDTVRRALAEPGLLKAVVYRPAAGTLLDHEARRNSAAVNTAAKALLDQPPQKPDALPPAEQAQAYETAYDYLYYRFTAGDLDPKTAPRQLRGLLVARSQVEAPDQRSAPPRPATTPAEGHKTRRLALGAGADSGEGFVSVTLRPAYHDLLDPPGGYRSGAHIDFLDTELRYETEAEKLRLQQFTLIAIDSLAERNAFLKPFSWGLDAGHKRIAVDKAGHFSEDERHGVSYFEGSAGLSGKPTESSLCYGQLKVDVQAGTVLEDGWRAGAGPRLGCLGNWEGGQWQLEASSLFRDDQDAWESRASLGWQWNLAPGHALRLKALLEAQDSAQRSTGSLDWVHYF